MKGQTKIYFNNFFFLYFILNCVIDRSVDEYNFSKINIASLENKPIDNSCNIQQNY